jgi:hypothetical protein
VEAIATKKTKVVSVRLSEDTHTRFEYIRNQLSEINSIEISQGNLMSNMIDFYFKYLENVDTQTIAEIQRVALVKALTDKLPLIEEIQDSPLPALIEDVQAELNK